MICKQNLNYSYSSLYLIAVYCAITFRVLIFDVDYKHK